MNTVSRNKYFSASFGAVKLLRHGDEPLDIVTNTLILNAFVDFICLSESLTVHLCRVSC